LGIVDFYATKNDTSKRILSEGIVAEFDGSPVAKRLKTPDIF